MRYLLFILITGLCSCTTTMQQTIDLPYGTKATGFSIRDGFTNDAGTVIYDKEGKIAAVIPSSNDTDAASVLSSVANSAIINNGFATGLLLK